MAPAPNRYVRQAVILSVFACAALFGIVTGVLFAYAPDLPEIEALDDYAPDTITRVHARGGELIGEFATERRDIIGYDDIPDVLRNAIIAAEDASFFDHQGISIPAGIRTVIQNVAAGDLTAAGASTLTDAVGTQTSRSQARASGSRGRGSARPGRSTTPSSSRSATRSGRYWRSTPTRSGSARHGTRPTASRRRRSSTSASPPGTSRSAKPP